MDHRHEGATPVVGIALAAGVLGAVQPEINAVLGRRLDSALVASLVNFAVAWAVTVSIVFFRPGTRRRLGAIRTWPAPRWTLAAGFGGAVVVLAGAVAVERIGVAIFTVAFVAGQITAGLLVDRLGIAPGGVRRATTARIAAIVLAALAVALAQAGQPAGELVPGLVAFSVAAGAAVALQSACNGRIASATGDPLAATAVNVSVGSVALAVVVAVQAAAGVLGPLDWPGEPWLYTGGALGAAIVLALALASAALGVLHTTLAMLGAQLIAALGVDWVVRDEPPRAGVLTGCALVLVAMAVVGRDRGRTPPPWQATPGPPPSGP